MYTNLPSLLSSCDAEVLLCLEGEGRGGGGGNRGGSGLLGVEDHRDQPLLYSLLCVRREMVVAESLALCLSAHHAPDEMMIIPNF